MKKSPILLILLLFLTLSPNCLLAQGQVQFPFPEIPLMLTDPQERLAFMLDHFWDNYHFSDTTRANQDLAEQGISDFINLLQYSDSALTARAAKRFVSQAFATEWGRRHYESLLDHYLGNPESPLRNDVVYAHLLRQMEVNLPSNDVRRSRIAYRLNLVTKNQTGKKAADFEYITRQGQRSTLYKTRGSLILLVFNDPECEHCHEIMPKLIANPALQDARLRVLSIYPDSDTPLWKKSPRKLPSNWTDCYSPSGLISQKQLYYLPAMPALYLLDAQKRVLVKDGTIDDILKQISKSKI